MTPPSDPRPAGVVITGLGVMSSIGHDARQAVSSIRAGINRFREVPTYEPMVRDPAVWFPRALVGAPVAGVTDGLSGAERLLALARPALHEAVLDAGLKLADAKSASLCLAGPQHAGAADDVRVHAVLAPRCAMLSRRVTMRGVYYFPAGSSGFLLALHDGMRQLRQNLCNRCVVGGVDSWFDSATLSWLDESRRLKSDSNPDAFIPGEAGAFLVIERSDEAKRRRARVYARCGDVFTAVEKHTIGSESVCTAESLVVCIRAVLRGLAPDSPAAILCDLNGESYRSKEWGYALARAFEATPSPPALLHPADCLGDVGAATGGILAAVTAIFLSKRVWSGGSALIWSSSDGGQRAAVALSAEP